jgi:hypothetical protein
VGVVDVGSCVKFVFGITCVEPSGLVIRERERERERNAVSVLFCVYTPMILDPNWLPIGLDNARIFFEILF